jgi:N-acetylneuraminate synthase
MSTLDEVDAAVELLRKEDANFALLHSNSSYPANPDDLNLNAIPFMKDRYGCVVGYSGHEYGLTPTVIAYAMGAMIIERHVTLDREMWGTDQSSSVEIQGMYSLKSRLKEVERSLGKAEKIVTESEIAVRKKLRGD